MQWRRWGVLIVLLMVAGAAEARPQTGPSGGVTGVVVDASTGAPLPGVLVELEDVRGTTATTDADGRFQLPAEPGAHTVRAVLIGYGLGRVDVDVPAGRTVDVVVRLAPGTAPFSEEVVVRPAVRGPQEAAAASFTWHQGELLATRGVLADDPLRAVQSAPEVSSGDDFRAELAVRGHDWRQLGVTLDGMDTRLLLHSVRGVSDTGSIAIFNTDVLQGARLDSGARAQPDAGRLGARLTFDLRDGARDRFAWRAAVSGTAASAVVEGPIDAGGRASFLGSVRQSYLDWLLRRVDPEAEETFGFVDGLARLSWQVAPAQLVRATFIGARSALRDSDPDDNGPNAIDTGRSATTLGNVEWQVAAGSAAVLTQRVWLARGSYRNATRAGGVRERGSDRETVYRADLLWDGGGVASLEGGARLGSVAAERESRTFTATGPTGEVVADRTDSSRAAWGQARLSAGSIRLSGGARAEWSRRSGVTTWSPWFLAEFDAAGTVVRGGVSRAHQHPAVDMQPQAGATLRPESSWLADLGLERASGWWSASLRTYYRAERDGLHDVRELPVQNRLDGRAYGLEAVVRRRAPGGLSGWLGYAWSDYRLEDTVTGERFPADHDRRHTVTAVALHRWSSRTSVTVRGRLGSGVPLPGHVDRVGDSYYLGTTRNATRLPAYARVDVRADRAFALGQRRLTLFVEVINLFNRRNLGPGDPSVDTRTGVIRDAVERLFPILPSVGLLLEW